PDTTQAEADRAIAELAEHANAFARMPPREKAALLRELIPTTRDVAAACVEDACRAKGIEGGSPLGGEEWLAGPFATLTNVRLLAQSLDDIAAGGRPRFAYKPRNRRDGRREILVHPHSMKDGLLASGIKAYVFFDESVRSEADIVAAQAEFYQKKDP